MRNYQEFYTEIIRPSFAPPEWMFGLAWGVIYPLMLIALVYLFYLVYQQKAPVYLLILYLVNWIANLLFTPIQLGLKPLWPATLDIFLVLITLMILEIKVYRYSKIIFWLLAPYLIWGVFATVLQATILLIN